MDPHERRGDLTTSLDLLHRAHDGDERALDRLFERYAPGLRRWAAGRLPRWARDLADTEDMVQEALLKTVRRLPEFRQRDGGGLHAYLRRALHNRVLDEIRRVRRRPPQGSLPAEAPDTAASALEETIGREAAERYEAALARLGEADREAVIARVELGLDYERIAEALGKPSKDAARMAVARAMVKLAEAMGHGE